MAVDKQLFAPMPLRAMGADLSGLQLRVLLCVAAHDRMSLVTEKGQGCRASNDRMKGMVGCSYARLCSTLSELCATGFLHREKLGRHTIYRIIYTDDDRLLFSNTSRAPIGCETGNSDAAIGCHDFSEAPGKLPKTASQYIPLNGGIHSVETGKENSSEDARLTSRDSQQVANRFGTGGEGLGRKVLHRDGEPLNETLAKFERQWKSNWTIYQGKLAHWSEWLSEQSVFAADNDDLTLSAWAQRLSETVGHMGWEIGEIVEDAA